MSTQTSNNFNIQELTVIRDRAINHFVNYPTRCRLEGMKVDLDDSDKRALAFFEASISFLNRMGVLDPERLKDVIPLLHTVVLEVIDEGVVRMSADARGQIR